MTEKKPVTALADWLREHDEETRAKLADDVGTSVSYLYILAGGHRRAGSELAKAIERETKAITPKQIVPRAELRPDLWEQRA